MTSTLIAAAIAGASGLAIATSAVVIRAELKSAQIRDRILDYLEV